ncbi:DUF6894 family protein [Methylobacterium sp. CM6257]
MLSTLRTRTCASVCRNPVIALLPTRGHHLPRPAVAIIIHTEHLLLAAGLLREGDLSDRGARAPRYFFDLHNSEYRRDDHGTQCADLEAARREAMLTLPEIARFAIPSGCDDQAFSMSIRDESSAVVYTASATFAGLTSNSAAEPEPLD